MSYSTRCDFFFVGSSLVLHHSRDQAKNQYCSQHICAPTRKHFATLKVEKMDMSRARIHRTFALDFFSKCRFRRCDQGRYSSTLGCVLVNIVDPELRHQGTEPRFEKHSGLE